MDHHHPSHLNTPLLADFPELTHLSREDLEDLLTDPLYFQAIFHSLDRVKALYQGQAELGSANETIANNNLRLQESLYQLRSETQDSFNEAKRLETRWKELEKEQKEVYQRFTPQFLLMRLKHSTIAQDDASEALATTFIQEQVQQGTSTPNGGAGVDEFIKEFKDLRKVYHKRRMWGERWSEVSILSPDGSSTNNSENDSEHIHAVPGALLLKVSNQTDYEPSNDQNMSTSPDFESDVATLLPVEINNEAAKTYFAAPQRAQRAIQAKNKI
ncbi:hypothetical protein H0H92_002224 [Tricholoma furcatifolium]|nr:hypothetical protein H0H92_002224 [Tricholoma furcatifolium]